MIKSIKSSLIPHQLHAFFTNKYSNFHKHPLSLDFSYSTLQSKSTTLKNRKLAIKCLEDKECKIFFVNQIHSTKVFLIDEQSSQTPLTGDGMVTGVEGTGLAILTADCAPVLFFDSVSNIIGAAHVGWRGALNGILENTINKMLEIGASQDNIIASIGPCISKANYEVDLTFKKEMIKNQATSEQFFLLKSNNKYLFDLPAYIEARLQNYGIKAASSVGVCTYEIKNNFHSFRRAQHTGVASHQRNISIIKL